MWSNVLADNDTFNREVRDQWLLMPPFLFISNSILNVKSSQDESNQTRHLKEQCWPNQMENNISWRLNQPLCLLLHPMSVGVAAFISTLMEILVSWKFASTNRQLPSVVLSNSAWPLVYMSRQGVSSQHDAIRQKFVYMRSYHLQDQKIYFFTWHYLAKWWQFWREKQHLQMLETVLHHMSIYYYYWVLLLLLSLDQSCYCVSGNDWIHFC